jgi:hypothetical protein
LLKALEIHQSLLAPQTAEVLPDEHRDRGISDLIAELDKLEGGSGQDNPEPSFAIGRYRISIDLKLNLLSLIAFLLSLSAVINQISAWMRQADLRAHEIKQITLFANGCDSSPDFKGNPAIEFAVIVGYSNAGQLGYNGTIMSEQFEVRADKMYNYYADSIVHTEPLGDYPTRDFECKNDSLRVNRLHVKRKSYRTAFVVESGKVAFDELWMIPVTPDCRTSDVACYTKNHFRQSDFVNFVSKSAQSPRAIEFSLKALTLTGETLAERCAVNLTNYAIETFERIGWLTLNCMDDPSA